MRSHQDLSFLSVLIQTDHESRSFPPSQQHSGVCATIHYYHRSTLVDRCTVCCSPIAHDPEAFVLRVEPHFEVRGERLIVLTAPALINEVVPTPIDQHCELFKQRYFSFQAALYMTSVKA
jgi:hypothetical protein